MTRRPVLLDLYCCAGGATMGYIRAGWHVIGVDIEPRPNYPGDGFIRANAIDVLRDMAMGVPGALRPDAVHSSPPCQKDNPLTKGTNRERRSHLHRSWTAETRELLDRIGLPYVIEQPAGSGEIREDLMLCMDMFKDRIGPPPWVWRHRMFELSGFTVPQPAHAKHVGRVRGWRHGVRYEGDYVAVYGSGGGKASLSEAEHALGIDWAMERSEIVEAIPPVYAEYIGAPLMLAAGYDPEPDALTVRGAP